MLHKICKLILLPERNIISEIQIFERNYGCVFINNKRKRLGYNLGPLLIFPLQRPHKQTQENYKVSVLFLQCLCTSSGKYSGSCPLSPHQALSLHLALLQTSSQSPPAPCTSVDPLCLKAPNTPYFKGFQYTFYLSKQPNFHFQMNTNNNG